MRDNAVHNTKVAIYARVSTEEQREGQTIDSQVAELKSFSAEKGWSVVDVYKDEGWSGSLLARPNLDRLRDDASLRKFDLVLINDVDRLARDVSHLGIVKRDLERSGVEIVFRKLPTEKSPTSNLMINILGSFAEFEREMIADRTRRGKRHKVETRQQFIGAKPAYGYRYIPRDRPGGQQGHLELVPEEAAVVKTMYDWVDREGLSARQVMQRLNSNSDQPRSGKKWAKSTVLRILRSEMYAGVWHYNKHYSCEPENPRKRGRYKQPKSSTRLRSRSDWLPVVLPEQLRVIERDQWERVQRQLTKNISFSPRNSQHFYLLKGLVRCGGCGGTFVGDPCHSKYYYRCVNRCKKRPTIKEEILDETVWMAIKEVLRNPSIIFNQVSQLQKRSESNALKVEGDTTEVNRALEQVRDEEARILEAYRRSIISASQLAHELEKLQARTKSLEARKGQVLVSRKNFSSLASRNSLLDYCRKVSRKLESFGAEQRQQLLRLLIERIVFEGTDVRIQGVFRLSDIKKSRTSDPDTFLGEETLGRTIPPAIGNYGRSSVVETPVNFFLVRPIPGRADRNPAKQAA